MVVKVPQKESRRREPKPRSHTLRVVTELGEQIVSGKLPQGSLLPGDSELCERFGVSRTVLREALKTLSGKGLLQARPRIGTRVRPQADWNLFDSEVLVWLARLGFTRAFLGHLGEMRMALEPEAAALAARRRTADQLQSMRSWHDRMAESGGSRQAFVAADLGLHLSIAAAADNPFLYREREEHRGRPRRINVFEYAIFYEPLPEGDGIFVWRVIHGARNLPRHVRRPRQ